MDSYLTNGNETNVVYYSKIKKIGMNWEPRNKKELSSVYLSSEIILDQSSFHDKWFFDRKGRNIKSLQIANRNDYFDLVSWLS